MVTVFGCSALGSAEVAGLGYLRETLSLLPREANSILNPEPKVANPKPESRNPVTRKLDSCSPEDKPTRSTKMRPWLVPHCVVTLVVGAEGVRS